MVIKASAAALLTSLSSVSSWLTRPLRSSASFITYGQNPSLGPNSSFIFKRSVLYKLGSSSCTAARRSSRRQPKPFSARGSLADAACARRSAGAKAEADANHVERERASLAHADLVAVARGKGISLFQSGANRERSRTRCYWLDPLS
uniref:Uncharacterized protein n=1 Tax=Chrysotila carterae TaxID=13221 RepID=A0A7S4ESS4_CHRCT